MGPSFQTKYLYVAIFQGPIYIYSMLLVRNLRSEKESSLNPPPFLSPLLPTSHVSIPQTHLRHQGQPLVMLAGWRGVDAHDQCSVTSFLKSSPGGGGWRCYNGSRSLLVAWPAHTSCSSGSGMPGTAAPSCSHLSQCGSQAAGSLGCQAVTHHLFHTSSRGQHKSQSLPSSWGQLKDVGLTGLQNSF